MYKFPLAADHIKDILPKITFLFLTTRNFGSLTLSDDRVDEIESIDSVEAKKTFFSVN